MPIIFNMNKLKIFVFFVLIFVASTVFGYTQNNDKIGANKIIQSATNSVYAKNWNLTEKYAKELIEKYPALADGYFYMGIALDEKGQYKKAIENYQKALNITQNMPDILQNIGLVYLHLKDYDNCIKYTQKALNVDLNGKYSKSQLKICQNQGKPNYSPISFEDASKEQNKPQNFMIKKDALSSKYLPGKSLASKQRVNEIMPRIKESLPDELTCSKLKIVKSDIREDLYFEGTSLDNSTGKWTEYWTLSGCGKTIEIPIMFNYIKGNLTIGFINGDYKILK